MMLAIWNVRGGCTSLLCLATLIGPRTLIGQNNPRSFTTAVASNSAPDTTRVLSALDSLAEEVARLTARYLDRNTAIADGYRRVGVDFPGMGQHWIHPGALMSGRIDASRPTMLSYATIEGQPTLLGVGFVVTTTGDAPVNDVPGWPDAWHEHSGLFADESGATTGRSSAATTSTHVWILHIWTQLSNPGGRYTADNWALPFRRVGIVAPQNIDADAGRALSLVVGGDDYLRRAMEDAGVLDTARAVVVGGAIDSARMAAQAIVARTRIANPLSASEVSELREVWTSLGAALRRALGSSVEPFLLPPHHGGRTQDHQHHG